MMSDTSWIVVANCPIKHFNQQHLHLKSNGNFITLGGESGNKNVAEYNPNTNKWQLRWKIDKEILQKCDLIDYTSGWDSQTQTIYILDRYGYFIEKNLSENSDTTYKLQKTDRKSLWSRSIMINGEFHVFSGSENNEHQKYNSESNKFETQHIFKEFDQISTVSEDIVSFSLLNTNETVILLGAWEISHHDWPYYKICTYHIQNNEWDVKDFSWADSCLDLDNIDGDIACTLAIRDKYILMFGGEWNNGHACGCTDVIYIYSLKQNKIVEAKMKCPRASTFSAVTISDPVKDDKLIHGFVRKQWKIANIDDHLFPPMYLLKLIENYILIEFIYLIDRKSGDHWKIDSLDIFKQQTNNIVII